LAIRTGRLIVGDYLLEFPTVRFNQFLHWATYLHDIEVVIVHLAEAAWVGWFLEAKGYAFLFLEETLKFFARDYPDVFYLRNFSRTLLLGLACDVQCEGAFCGEMGIDSQDSADFDIFFRETPAGYIAMVSTEKGQALTGGKGFFEEAAADEWNLSRGKIRRGRENPLFLAFPSP
jgi:hypothetical protein